MEAQRSVHWISLNMRWSLALTPTFLDLRVCSAGRLATIQPQHSLLPQPSPCILVHFCSIITAHLVLSLWKHLNPQNTSYSELTVHKQWSVLHRALLRHTFVFEIVSEVTSVACVCVRVVATVLSYKNICSHRVDVSLVLWCLPQNLEGKLEEILKEIKSLKDLVSSQEKRIIQLEEQMSKIAM